jgi:uridine kinase
VQVKIGGEVYNRVIHYETLAALESEVRSYFSEELTEKLDILKAALADGNHEVIRTAMHAVVPTFHEPEEVNREQGEEVEIPVFNFKTGRREWCGHVMRMSKDTVFIIEGLHALNPVLLPEGLDKQLVFRLYVSPLLPLNLDDHNRIPTSYLRLLRRTVRDFESRGSSVERTISMWDSVRAGEKRWIFPFQENADMIFNSSTLYELAVLKKHIFPLLTAVGPENPVYDEVRSIVKVLNFVQEADVDDEIPPTSLVREFIGGNSFYR